MLLDLKGHYLDLIVTAVEAGGNACLHRADAAHNISSGEKGAIYVTRSAKDTKTEYVIQYRFGPDSVALGLEFADGRPKFGWIGQYVAGLEEFWPAFRKALSAYRLEAPHG